MVFHIEQEEGLNPILTKAHQARTLQENRKLVGTPYHYHVLIVQLTVEPSNNSEVRNTRRKSGSLTEHTGGERPMRPPCEALTPCVFDERTRFLAHRSHSLKTGIFLQKVYLLLVL